MLSRKIGGIERGTGEKIHNEKLDNYFLFLEHSKGGLDGWEILYKWKGWNVHETAERKKKCWKIEVNKIIDNIKIDCKAYAARECEMDWSGSGKTE